MRSTIVLCHPGERSFCHALAAAARDAAAHYASDVAPAFHDLYADPIDPVLSASEIARRYSLDETIQRYGEELAGSDLLVVVHPDWWSGPPALLKGWIERVMRPGIAYDWDGPEFTEKVHTPLLTNTALIVLVTTDRAEDDPPRAIEAFWSDVGSYSGMHLVAYRVYPDIRRSGHRERAEWVRAVPDLVAEAAKERSDD